MGPFYDRRMCAFEQYLNKNNPEISFGLSSNPGSTHPYLEQDKYVEMGNNIYRRTAITRNSTDSTPNTKMKPIQLVLEKQQPENVLHDISTHPGQDSVVKEVARSGAVQTREEIDVPQTPIQPEQHHSDQAVYYRVYLADRTEPPIWESIIYGLSLIMGPILGLLLLDVSLRRFEISHVDDTNQN